MGECWHKFYDGLWRQMFLRIVTVLVILACFGAFGMLKRKSAEPDDINESIKITWKPPLLCTTPSGAIGTCTLIDYCTGSKTLHKAQCEGSMFCCADETYTSTYPPSSTKYRSIATENCAWAKDPRCRSSHQTQEPVGSKCNMSLAPPDPASQCCGVDTESNEITGSPESRTGHFPWTVALEYEQYGINKVRYAGTLISGRYVLTAAHCVLDDRWTLKNVRLGNCVNVVSGGNGCNDAEVVPVQEIITHPSFNTSSKSYSHDIALVKLDRMVNYTDFIRPICLPSVDFTKDSIVDISLYNAGSITANNIVTSTKIKTAKLFYVDQLGCQSSFKLAEVEIEESQICALGNPRLETCIGDPGGPLMRTSGKFMELVGIDSFGIDGCTKAEIPNVYTKVHTYLSWIKDHIVA
ncbi:phenoloxidase-activating enzyme-like isoform X2 [Epargyreus clarus]|uniref:phenoloxidase-activating enzyme-like isoform X2 n=1 Tax=Epargyreus clarus TaxID=520877 RepID=UPI003C2DFC03